MSMPSVSMAAAAAAAGATEAEAVSSALSPQPLSSSSSSSPSSLSLLDPNETFASLCDRVGLDPRLRRALARLGYARPTLVQSACLPLAIHSGRDLLVRARTGSGKTLAYCLPVLHKILARKSGVGAGDGSGVVGVGGREDGDEEDEGGIRAVILAPTRELCSQVHGALVDLTYYCDDVVAVALLTGPTAGTGGGGRGRGGAAGSRLSAAMARQEAMLRDRPDVIVSTPAGFAAHVRSEVAGAGTGAGASGLAKSVESLVVDEADLVLSFGYTNDITDIMKSLPKICQGFLMSATLSPELDSLKRVVLHSPAVLKLEEEHEDGMGGRRNAADGGGGLTQFYLRLPRKDKNLVLYVFLKLGLLRGKGLFFVNSTDGAYRLKLFLEQFHIRSAVLNGELPLRSRLNIIEQFNVGNFDYLIATDESTDAKPRRRDDDDDDDEEEDDEEDEEEEEEGDDEGEDGEKKRKKSKKKKKSTSNSRRAKRRLKKRKDSEYGVSRGLDFRGVSFVVNFDFPSDPDSYTHRVGRTARGGAKGVALSFVEMESPEQSNALGLVQDSQPRLASVPPAAAAAAAGGGDGGGGVDDALRTDVHAAANDGQRDLRQPMPLEFDMRDVEGFRYRVEDVGRAVTKVAVQETRAAELRAEILNSVRLQNHFEENPSDFKILRHDRIATHISRVQEHLKHVPDYMLPRGMQAVQIHTRENKRPTKKKKKNDRRNARGGGRGASKDPLKSFSEDVNLDGIADVGDDDRKGGATTGSMTTAATSSDSAYFDDEDDMGGSYSGKPSFTNGMGKSTAGRNRWKERNLKRRGNCKYDKVY